MNANFIKITRGRIYLGENLRQLEHCPDCGTMMEEIHIFQKGREPIIFILCPKCHEPELTWWK